MDGKTLVRRYGEGKRDFSWADLRAADLAQAQLSNINLYRANLAGANLVGVNLRQANLFKANLTRADLTGADLTGANLRRADLTATHLNPTQLQAAADLRGAVGIAPVTIDSAGVVTDDTDEIEQSVNLPFDEPSCPPSAPSAQPLVATPQPAITPLDRRETVISLAILGIGYLFYGILLGAEQVAFGFWLLVWLPVCLGLWQEELLWFGPMLGAIAVVASLGISAGVLLFFLPVAMGLGISLAICGSIMGWGWGQSFKTTLWFSGLAFLAMHSVIWLFDGSNAYGGGGIVLNLSTLHIALLLGLGLLAVVRGALAYGQLALLRVPKSRQWLYIGSSAAAGLLVGVVVGS
ncbi:pentapeptide repeat-containing protein [Leptolyngbya sp. CCNP1308]|uniref:pentapeptide repeat-containing protein n=1 Tax=Leptolyngbya sp. CCNP1308 TaxID=3110255 RepID=UPI002B1EBF7C|nr:pentapeptide repeat-containing protein [Leptolyngbya sp. CCNP1308]MEA5450629.1 pentapeptide repeat-containing protein [Leptolyngbya sp. CCNP1308]